MRWVVKGLWSQSHAEKEVLLVVFLFFKGFLLCYCLSVVMASCRILFQVLILQPQSVLRNRICIILTCSNCVKLSESLGFQPLKSTTTQKHCDSLVEYDTASASLYDASQVHLAGKDRYIMVHGSLLQLKMLKAIPLLHDLPVYSHQIKERLP